MAVKSILAACAAALALTGCGTISKVLPEAGASNLAPIGKVSRADIAKSGQPVMKLTVPSRGIETFLTIRDRRGDVVNWMAADGTLFSFRNDVLIETRGLGADLMSSAAPSAGQILGGQPHRRTYFFVDDDDQTGRRDYSCQMSQQGSEPLVIYGRSYNASKLAETCERDIGRITNYYWVEGGKIRKSREWVSRGIGQIEFERVID